MTRKLTLVILLFCLQANLTIGADKPKLTLDDFFNSVEFEALRFSPDGNSLVVGTNRADWEHSIFRHDLWLYREVGTAAGTLVQLTQSGHDTDPHWSPDGKWIAFLSERKTNLEKGSDNDDAESKDSGINQLYLISATGSEAFAVTEGEEEVHAFAWSRDSHTLYFATRLPWTKAQKDAYKKNWKDTLQYRAAERADVIFSLDLASAIARHHSAPAQPPKEEDQISDATPGARPVANAEWRVQQMAVSPDGRQLAFTTSSISERQEKTEEFEIYLVDLTQASSQAPRRLTKNAAVEQDIHWSTDNRHVFFNVEVGDVSGPYRDLQPHLYWVDAKTGEVQQWSKDFVGSVNHYAIGGDRILVAGRQGTEVPLYFAEQPSKAFSKLPVWPGTYDQIATAEHSGRIAFVYSSLERPSEVYLAENADQLASARPITSFNKLFTERDLPQGKPYRWKSDDGTSIEGMLMYPPGKFGQKNLPMFTFIHGGPNDADGNHFEADWYQWDRLAATQGWLVFEPNYRGSTGYGDEFLRGIVPEIVSRPGKDILAGVDALVRDGIADPDHLAIGGYSYGGYMTNWLITQTTRFRVAVTGAGAVEHVANWGNDDTTFDDAYFLGGRPWEAPQRYHDEAAIFQIDKVRTPTHVVAGAADIRVAVSENYLLDRALHSLGIPSTLLIFPGEGHSLKKNPWHGKIKVREELQWLQKYGGLSNP